MTSFAPMMEAGEESAGIDAFSGINTWIFDLDDTLYPRSSGLHEQMRQRVVRFIVGLMKIDPGAAEAVHVDYYTRYGSTLQALVQLHGVAPVALLDFVHDIDLSALTHNQELIAALKALPGRRVVFTNSSRRHAGAVLAAMGMTGLFDAVGSIEDGQFIGKPQHGAYAGFLDRQGIDPRSSVMFDDRVGNLTVPHDLGMRTVLVVDPLFGAAGDSEKPAYVDTVVPDLTAFLREVAERRQSSNES
jgi:putative hydrolase of the HAD superfamily